MLSENVETTLSQREREVVLLAVDGLTTEEMAQSLEVSPSTIKAHLLNIYRKLGIKKRVQLIRFADTFFRS
ncbi:MAG TPA: helix-turn-helix transcriptional regulator [Syntrophorhabdales bacterium]|nr:helix-turn-helix transcriptional regulator [Syntrophorhabdales bacterium]